MNYEQKTVTVDGVEYTLQKMPVRPAIKMRQEWQMGAGLIDDEKMYELVLKNIVVEPKVNLDDFTSIHILEELVKKAMEFQYLGK